MSCCLARHQHAAPNQPTCTCTCSDCSRWRRLDYLPSCLPHLPSIFSLYVPFIMVPVVWSTPNLPYPTCVSRLFFHLYLPPPPLTYSLPDDDRKDDETQAVAVQPSSSCPLAFHLSIREL